MRNNKFTATSLSEFVRVVLDLKPGPGEVVAFRGEKFAGWQTLPKLFRSKPNVFRHEKHLIRDLMSVHPSEFDADSTMFDRLVRMQHFGLPTRLLDVSNNPLVALYFASETYFDNTGSGEPGAADGKVDAYYFPRDRQRYFDSDRVSCMSNLANLTVDEQAALRVALKDGDAKFNESPIAKRLTWFVRLEKPHFEPRIIPNDLIETIFVHPKMSNRRIIAQNGAFILFGRRDLTTDSVTKDLRPIEISIPAKSKQSIRNELNRIGIHESSLFPELERAAEYITARYAARFWE